MSVVFLGSLIAVAGCTQTQWIALNDYQVTGRAAGDPDVAVALRVVDARRLSPGASPDEIGVLHAPFETSNIRLTDAAAVSFLVGAATKDALRLARVGVSPQAPRTLVVAVRTFWVAAGTNEPFIVADFVLEDRHATALWTGSAAGGAGGAVLYDFPQSMLRSVFQRSLADYAAAASRDFASADFQRQIY